MSARNYLSAKEKNVNKVNKPIEFLSNLNKQKFNYLPVLSGHYNGIPINRNMNYSFAVQPFGNNDFERASTPFSDFFSESETGTPDLRSEESDSSAGSALRQSTAEATRALAAEWDRIERTIYGENGEKVTKPQMLEECRQWQQLHPQMRIVGKGIPLPEKKLYYRQIEHEEILALHYSDYQQFSESEERLSDSASDCTPQNSPRKRFVEEITEPKLTREKMVYFKSEYDNDLPDSFCSLLHITPIPLRSPPRKRQNSSILKSEITSSKWMRNKRPDSSVTCDRNSAKSFLSLDTRNYETLVLSAKDRIYNNTAKQRDFTKLEPLYTAESIKVVNHGYMNRKISLPPLLIDDDKKKVNSAKKQAYTKPRRSHQKSFYQLNDNSCKDKNVSWND